MRISDWSSDVCSSDLYFPSKEALFEAVVDDIVDYYGAALQVELPVDEDVLPVLRRFGQVLMTTLTSDPLLALYQLVVGAARRFPHLAEAFYERGPRRGQARDRTSTRLKSSHYCTSRMPSSA